MIAGAGIIGTSTAYYLATKYGIRTTLIDPTGSIAPAASGKAGGFLALDWNDYAVTGPLTRRSFQLHQELADAFGAHMIQYRRLSCVGITVDAWGQRPSGKKLAGIEWAQADQDSRVVASRVRELGSEDTIAQVHPKLLCERLWAETQQCVGGCRLLNGRVVDVQHDDTGTLIGAVVAQTDELNSTKTVLAADAVLFACGPWTAPGLMYGVKYHSVVLPTDRVLNQCVFFSGCGDPEVYVRPDATAYCTGFPDPPIAIDERPGEEVVRSEKITAIVEAVHDASSGVLKLSGESKMKQQACYLPSTDDNIPIMGKIPGTNSCYIAAGHTCWGILMGPASGECMADLIGTGQSKHMDLEPFSPERFGRFHPIRGVHNRE